VEDEAAVRRERGGEDRALRDGERGEAEGHPRRNVHHVVLFGREGPDGDPHRPEDRERGRPS
jgi:hypothetical protein